jgi:hypothetical protein
MDWAQSGIKHAFSFQLVDAVNLTDPRGWLDNVTGGKLTEAYRGDMRASCTLDIDGGEIPLGCAVRIWHEAEAGGETVRECLGTFQPDPAGGTYESGRLTGSVECLSSLGKLSTTLGKRVISVGNSNIAAHFSEIVGWAKAVPWVAPNWNANKTFAAPYVWVMATESVLAEAQRCADAMGGYLGVDEQGRVTLTPYTEPRRLAESWQLLPGGVVHFGVDVDVPAIVNRVTAKYEHRSGNDTKTYTAEKHLEPSHPWSVENIGRWEAIELTNVTVEDGQDPQTILDDAVKKELESRAAAMNTYSITANYDAAVRCGTAGRLVYRDSPDDEGINARVFCSGREIRLDYTAEMALTLEQQ